MGTRNKKLSWSWPLISLKWIAEILSSFDHLIEPTWIGLKRQITFQVANTTFSSNIFKQLQRLLTELQLVEETGRIIQPTIKPTETCVKKHLIHLCEYNSASWATYFFEIYRKQTQIIFNQMIDTPPVSFPEISSYPVFKQWAQYFQYIGYGLLIEPEYFIPESMVTDKFVYDVKFIEKCLKAIDNPRQLTGKHSLHTEGDFLVWSKGEDYLPISEDSKLIPRIPHDRIYEEWLESKPKKGALLGALNEGMKFWYQMIDEKIADSPFSDLISTIYTCKKFIDYFLFGKSILDNDFIDKENIFAIQKKWEFVNHFKMPNNLWKLMPNLYKDITRLNWGITHYRNSLQRPTIRAYKYDDTLFNSDFEFAKKIPIRCSRSKRSLHAILNSLSKIYASIMRLNDHQTYHHYQGRTKKLLNELNHYIPSDPLEKIEVLAQLDKFIELTSQEKNILKNRIQVNSHFDFPQDQSLKICFWVHKYHDLQEIPQTAVIKKIKEQLELLQKRYIKDICYYEKYQDEWNIACDQIKKIASDIKWKDK